MRAPCGHTIPIPDSCKWCNLGVNKDRRYGAQWWGDKLPLPSPSSQETTQHIKPRLSISQLAHMRSKCAQRKAQGLPCEEFSTMAQVRWAYGITCVPQRKDTTLRQSIVSLRRAGFVKPTLFVDGLTHLEAAQWEREFKLGVVNRNPPNCKTFGNWILALGELLVRSPGCHYYALFQDDLLSVTNVGEYISRQHLLGTLPKGAYLNLYTWGSNYDICPVKDGNKDQGWFEARTYNSDKAQTFHGKLQQNGRGAVGLVFPQAAVIDLLTHRDIVERPMVPRGWRGIDGGICQTLNKCGWREWVHNPSLLQHTGKRSTMYDKEHVPSPCFPGQDFDCLSLLSSNPISPAPTPEPSPQSQPSI